MTTIPTWTNWARDQRCTPVRVLAPASVDELADGIVAAGAEGLRVRAHGSGHSFTPIALSDELLVDCTRLDGVEVEPDAGLVRAGAGVRLAALNRALDDAGMALPNLGDIDVQTVAGAVSTATHGTGAALPSMSGLVEAVELVLADGSVRTIGRGDPDLPAAQAGLGALGVLSAVTLRCVPAFTLDQASFPLATGRLLEEMHERAAAHDHFEFFVFASAGAGLVKTRDRTGAPPRPRSRARAWVEDVAIENGVLATALAAGRRWPGAVPGIDRLVTRVAGSGRRVERSAAIFASPRLFRFTETEWAVPAEGVADLVTEALAITRRHRVGMPLEVRWVAADEPWLSPANGRASCYLAAHAVGGFDHRAYFRDIEAVMAAAGGRPHWGKRHELGAAELAPRYPLWAAFQQVRACLDPSGRFANAHLDRVLGPVPA